MNMSVFPQNPNMRDFTLTFLAAPYNSVKLHIYMFFMMGYQCPFLKPLISAVLETLHVNDIAVILGGTTIILCLDVGFYQQKF